MVIPHSRPWITVEDREAVDEVLRSRFIGRCTKVEELENRIRDKTGRKTLCVGSGRAAIVLALQEINAKRVGIPTYSSDDFLDACKWADCEPVPYDIGGSSVATTVIHIEGQEGVTAIKASTMIHDYAHQWPSLPLPIGDIGVFSFGPLKPYTGGHGGAIAGLDLDRHKCWNLSPMSDINAALVLSKLNREPPKKRLITVESFEAAEQDFRSKGIVVRHETGALVHRLMGLLDRDFPNAVMRWNTIVSVPNYPDLTDEEKERIDDACRHYSV